MTQATLTLHCTK